MVIYCNGDSFVQGRGLGDSILPGYPHGADQFECAEWVKDSYSPSNTNRELYAAEISKLEIERRWSSKLEVLSGHKVINSAQAGGSMQRTARTTISDLIKLKQTESDIIAIIGISPISRSELYYKLAWWSINPGSIDQYKSEPLLESYCKLKIEHYTDDHSNLVQWYLSTIQIYDFCKNNNIPLLWVDTYQTRIWPKSVHRNVEILKSYIDINYDIIMDDLEVQNGPKFLPDGHFSEEIHALTAEALNTRIKEIQGTQ